MTVLGYRVTYRWRDDPAGSYRHQSPHRTLDLPAQLTAAQNSVIILMRPPQRCQEAFVELLTGDGWCPAYPRA